ncbi:MAG: DUF3786 domain-containing protein [Spirochaetaceae bacterium]|nr:MAG: DUF3786 domain-containing protein [Spirochaetaceae bacterium]
MSPDKSGGVKAAYGIAYRKACGELRSRDIGELRVLCSRSGAVLNGRTIRLPFFSTRVEIRIPEDAEPEFNPEELPLVEKILILHYLLGRDEKSTKGNMVAFKNLPGASFYDPTYQKRGPRRIARRFGEDVEAFRVACRNMNWREEQLGDASFQFDILPKLRGLVVLHAGDEEFPAEANILFNDDIINFLPLEDVAVLAGLIATRLGKSINP